VRALRGFSFLITMMDKMKDVPKVSKKDSGKKAKKEVPPAPKDDAKAPTERLLYTPEESARTVMLFGCPKKATEETLSAQFPSAEQVRLLFHKKRFAGRAHVRFTTKAQAEGLAKTGIIKIDGKFVRAVVFGKFESPEQKAKRQSEENSKKVHLSGLATDATEEDVRKAFPTAQSVRVIKNRKGESAGQALVFFLSAEKAKAVVGRKVDVKGVKVTPIAAGDYKPPEAAEPKGKETASSDSAAQPTTETKKPKENKAASSESADQPAPEQKSAKKRKRTKSAHGTEPPAEPEVSKSVKMTKKDPK